MAALTKADLSEHLNDVVGLNKREAKEMVEILFDELSDSLISGDPVRLSGFGNFELRDKNERPGLPRWPRSPHCTLIEVLGNSHC